VGADLHLHDLVLGTQDGGVEGTVAVYFGLGDKIVELLRDLPPQAVDLSEGGIAVGYLVDQNAYRQEVVDLIESDLLVPHLAPDAVDVFGSAGDLGRDAATESSRRRSATILAM